MVSRVIGVRVHRNGANVLKSVALEATWLASAVVAGRVGTGSVASYCAGSGVRSVGKVGADNTLTELTRSLVAKEADEF